MSTLVPAANTPAPSRTDPAPSRTDPAPSTTEPVPPVVAPAPPEPEADLAQHGSVSLAGGGAELRFTPQNFGPADIDDATVRLDWSEPLADGQSLPASCVRADRSSLVCRTGGLVAGSLGERIDVPVRFQGAPSEVTLRIGTLWNGGARDGNPENNEHEVLVLDTGDVYHF
ncbi:hypothetical protein [Streptomyces uncialis]|uniref:hypothetical protein n=1 Tax=Streptomyces uncialis TaxID=1048205 RepID=UPI0037891D9F